MRSLSAPARECDVHKIKKVTNSTISVNRKRVRRILLGT